MDTIGSIVDKLATVNNKMFFNQEFLYDIKKITFDEFLSRYKENETSLFDLYVKLHKVVDLNLQRQSLILEHDKMLVNLIKDLIQNRDVSSYVVDQHKTLTVEDDNEI